MKLSLVFLFTSASVFVFVSQEKNKMCFLLQIDQAKCKQNTDKLCHYNKKTSQTYDDRTKIREFWAAVLRSRFSSSNDKST